MRKLIGFLFLLISLNVSAAPIHLEKKWGAVIDAISQVESRGRANIVSRCGRYVGYLQISTVLVNQCNKIAGYKKYTYKDRYDKQKSIDMFIDYQEHFNPEGNMEKAIRLWNSGDINCMKRKAATEAYYRKVMANYTEMAKADV